MVSFSFIPNPFPSLITLEDRFGTVGKKNTSQENRPLEAGVTRPPGPLGPTFTDCVGEADSVRGQLLVRCLFSLFDPKPQKK